MYRDARERAPYRPGRVRCQAWRAGFTASAGQHFKRNRIVVCRLRAVGRSHLRGLRVPRDKVLAFDVFHVGGKDIVAMSNEGNFNAL